MCGFKMGWNGRIFVTFCYKFGQLAQKLNLKKNSDTKMVLHAHLFVLGEESRPRIGSVTLSGHVAVFIDPSH
jgi:hypothetical protein